MTTFFLWYIFLFFSGPYCILSIDQVIDDLFWLNRCFWRFFFFFFLTKNVMCLYYCLPYFKPANTTIFMESWILTHLSTVDTVFGFLFFQLQARVSYDWDARCALTHVNQLPIMYLKNMNTFYKNKSYWSLALQSMGILDTNYIWVAWEYVLYVVIFTAVPFFVSAGSWGNKHSL